MMKQSPSVSLSEKEIEALEWLISQRFLTPETDNIKFNACIDLLKRLKSATASPETAVQEKATIAKNTASQIYKYLQDGGFLIRGLIGAELDSLDSRLIQAIKLAIEAASVAPSRHGTTRLVA